MEGARSGLTRFYQGRGGWQGGGASRIRPRRPSLGGNLGGSACILDPPGNLEKYAFRYLLPFSSFQKCVGWQGSGLVHTSSPLSPHTAFPGQGGATRTLSTHHGHTSASFLSFFETTSYYAVFQTHTKLPTQSPTPLPIPLTSPKAMPIPPHTTLPNLSLDWNTVLFPCVY